jgi:DNA helicase HerA-like ATPase
VTAPNIVTDETKTFHNAPQKSSWLKLMGQFRMLMRSEIFDAPQTDRIDWEELMVAGRVIVLDLGDTANRTVSNLMIAHFLRNLRRVQEDRYQDARKHGGFLVPVEIFLEESHESLAGSKAQRMEMVLSQMRELILRGRKRKLGICLITQYPQQMPREMLDSMHSAILHEITGEETIRGLKHSVPAILESQWRAIGSLAQGSALVAFPGQLKMPVVVDVFPCCFRIITPLGN